MTARIIIEIMGMLVFSCALAVASYVVAGKIGRAASMVAAALAVGGVVAYSMWLNESAFFALMIPGESVMILSRWFPLFAAVIAGFAWRLLPNRTARRLLTIGPLIFFAIFKSYADIACGVVDVRRDVWLDGVCLQTTNVTCSAASAATALRAKGINTSEREMASACYTTIRGTTFLGLVRGLRIKTAGTGILLKPDYGLTVADLKQMVAKGPVVIWVRLDEGEGTDPRYREKWGWVPGVSHAVVVFSFPSADRVEIGDPSVGREQWSIKGLNDLWHGEGILLEDRGDGNE
ncbi:MAG: hypothetical protein JXR97_02785 [Planctomycetes bacterium]|nr:hypothetical protein [Planctomycetota bacterium]